jgi:outer membrane lipoprotein SlyB
MADDKNRDTAGSEHHSKAKGAAIGAVAGGAIAGKKGAVAGAAIGAEKQHRKNEEEKGRK